MKPKFYHDHDIPLETGIFSMAEIEAANRRHDRQYGFSFRDTHHYSNLMRHPESIVGGFLENVCRQHEQEQEANREQEQNRTVGFSEAA